MPRSPRRKKTDARVDFGRVCSVAIVTGRNSSRCWCEAFCGQKDADGGDNYLGTWLVLLVCSSMGPLLIVQMSPEHRGSRLRGSTTLRTRCVCAAISRSPAPPPRTIKMAGVRALVPPNVFGCAHHCGFAISAPIPLPLRMNVSLSAPAQPLVSGRLV